MTDTLARTLLLVAIPAALPFTHGQTSTNRITDISGTSWQLVKFQGGDDTVLMPDDRSKYTVAFGADGAVSARIDCNRGRGTWKSPAASQLRLGPLALTRAKCPPGSLHDHIVKQWEHVRSYTIRDGHLFLSLVADGGIYEFEPVSSAQSAGTTPLENTYWRLTRLGDSPITASSGQKEPHFILNPESRRVAGSGGCNRLTGSYELAGSQLTFGRIAGTMMACPKGMDIEKAFLDSLKEVKTWKIEGQQLELLDARGNAVSRFEAGQRSK